MGFALLRCLFMPPGLLKAHNESDTHRIIAAQPILRKKRLERRSERAMLITTGELKKNNECRTRNIECRSNAEWGTDDRIQKTDGGR